MRSKSLICSIAIAGWLGLSSAVSLGQEKQAPERKEDKAMAAEMALAGPAEEHRRLEALAGAWDEEIKVWFRPGATPITIKAKSVNTMILGGRFLKMESKGTMGGMTVEALSIVGFDRRTKKYTQVGYDSTGTYYVTAAGEYDPSQNAILMYGEDFDPIIGGTQKYNFITRFISPTKYVREVVFKDEAHTKGRGDFKAVEITSTKTQ
jgi:hypothetical protein